MTQNFKPDKTDINSLIISFIIINFAFLYHTLNFMWGNHDVKFIKEELLLSSGLFEGRFTQFIPYRLLVNGQILPILNNLLGLGFLTLALWLLAKYWNITRNTVFYTIFITFAATQPYTLSWLYFTFITISCLLWVLLTIAALQISSYIPTSKHKIALSACAIILFYLPLGGYPPIINLFFIGLGGKIILSYIFEEKKLIDLVKHYHYTLLNIILAAILFKISLKFVMPDNVYNLETTALDELPQKFLTTLKISFSQFLTTLPFMEKGYKTILTAMSLSAIIFGILSTRKISRKIITFLMCCGIIWLTSLTTFLVVPHTEYVSRIDFYGFAFLYTFFLAVLLNGNIKLSQSLALLFTLILIPFNILNDYRALKVWNLGFTSEIKILDSITERIENNLTFNPKHQYRFYQIGDISLRPSYYNGTFAQDDVFLHSLPYLAMWQGKNLIEFYSPFTYIDQQTTILPQDITPEMYNFFQNDARPWPHKNSIYMNQNIIIIILNQFGLTEFKQQLKSLKPKI